MDTTPKFTNTPSFPYETRYIGEVEKLFETFGFVSTAERNRYFFHFGTCASKPEMLRVGDPVEFVLGNDMKTARLHAQKVRKLNSSNMAPRPPPSAAAILSTLPPAAIFVSAQALLAVSAAANLVPVPVLLTRKLDEFNSQIIPYAVGLLRLKNGPVHLTDPTLMDILNGSSLEMQKTIAQAGGLGAALAQTGYFVIESDTIRLKETANLQVSLPICGFTNGSSHNFNGQMFMGTVPKYDDQQAMACAIYSSSEERFCNNGQSPPTNGAETHQSPSTSLLSMPFSCSPNANTGGFDAELIDRRSSLSSGFEEDRTGSAKSEQELNANGIELLNLSYPQRMQRRESFDSGHWPCESPWENVQCPQPIYGPAATARFIPHPQFIRPYWQLVPSTYRPQACFREYKLFDGSSIEDSFRRAMPNVYGGTDRSFESTKGNNEHFIPRAYSV